MKLLYAYYLSLVLLLFSCIPEWSKKEPVEKIIRDTVYIHDTIVVIYTPPPSSDTSYFEFIYKNIGLVNVQDLDPTIHVHLRYADTNNLLKQDFYDGLKNAYLNCDAAIMLANAQYYLKQMRPDLSLLVLDAARPNHIQQLMWDSLKMSDQKKEMYLSPPEETSLHNYGCAVDVTLVDLITGKELDMGGEYDYFGAISHTVLEDEFLKSGKLSAKAYANRQVLRNAMKRAGFYPIKREWWHFSICTKKEAAKKYKLIK